MGIRLPLTPATAYSWAVHLNNPAAEVRQLLRFVLVLVLERAVTGAPPDYLVANPEELWLLA